MVSIRVTKNQSAPYMSGVYLDDMNGWRWFLTFKPCCPCYYKISFICVAKQLWQKSPVHAINEIKNEFKMEGMATFGAFKSNCSVFISKPRLYFLRTTHDLCIILDIYTVTLICFFIQYLAYFSSSGKTNSLWSHCEIHWWPWVECFFQRHFRGNFTICML